MSGKVTKIKKNPLVSGSGNDILNKRTLDKENFDTFMTFGNVKMLLICTV